MYGRITLKFFLRETGSVSVDWNEQVQDRIKQ
jgi:hypothetical protein